VANLEHVEIVKQGAKAIEQWRKKNPKVQLDLSGADLSNFNLTDADLSEADLRGANLKGILFKGLNLNDAEINETTLIGSGLVFVPIEDRDDSSTPSYNSFVRLISRLVMLILLLVGLFILLKILLP
tara:strand:+ start:97755 stop:98135 length:381 start_codon:yes stop_codon:yes gene_type:complete